MKQERINLPSVPAETLPARLPISPNRNMIESIGVVANLGVDIKPEGEIMAQVIIDPNPIKSGPEIKVSTGDVEKQAMRAIDSLVNVDYKKTRGTCVDERVRAGLSSGESIVEPRPSAAGGPNIYGLYMAELTGLFGNRSGSGEDNLRAVTKIINEAGIKSGGHKKCAANAQLNAIVGIIADLDNRPAIEIYAQKELGKDYNQTFMNEVFGFAEGVLASDRYKDWDESVLERVLGSEAGVAIEVLVDAPHQAKTLVRQGINGKTVDQTSLHKLDGEDSFVNDEPYCDVIEKTLAKQTTNVEHALRLMRHAREAVLAGVANAVPNEELHQIRLV